MPDRPSLFAFPHLMALPTPSLWAAALALCAFVMTVLGLFLAPWHHFAWAGLTTQAPFHLSGQLCIASAATSVGALWAGWPAKRARWRWSAVWLGWVNVAMFAAAPMLASAGLTLNPLESVGLVDGHSLALGGACGLAMVASWVAGQEARPTSDEPWVQVSVLWDGQPIDHYALPPHRSVRVGHAVPHGGVDLPTALSPRCLPLIRTVDGVPAVFPPVQGRTLYDGRLAPPGTPLPLSPARPILVEFERVALSCTLEPMPERVPGGFQFDERLAAAIAVSTMVQLAVLTYAALGG